MKIAVLGDTHANWVALQAVAADVDRWQPDAVFVLGDVINRGPMPRECLTFIQTREARDGWRTVRGNHEDYVLSVGGAEAAREGPVYAIAQSSHWTHGRVRDLLPAILAWPFARHQRLGDPRSTLQVVHASLAGNRSGIYLKSGDDEVARLAGSPPPAVLVCGHTHRAMCRNVGETLVVNAGSAGLPFDGDWQPSYARLTLHRGQWRAQITRLAYDRDAALRDFETSGFLEGGGPLVPLMVDELRGARSHIAEWQRAWESRVLSGEIGAEESVRRYLDTEASTVRA